LEVGVGDDQARPAQARIGRFAFVVTLALLSGLLVYGLTIGSLYKVSADHPRVAEAMGVVGPPAFPVAPPPDTGVMVMMQNAKCHDEFNCGDVGNPCYRGRLGHYFETNAHIASTATGCTPSTR
jgi:hypothetical protein